MDLVIYLTVKTLFIVLHTCFTGITGLEFSSTSTKKWCCFPDELNSTVVYPIYNLKNILLCLILVL